MKTYVFRLPDNFDIKQCFTRIDNGKVIADMPIDMGIFERIESEIIEVGHDRVLAERLGMLLCNT